MISETINETPVAAVVIDTPVEAPMAHSASWLDSIKERFGGQESWAVELVTFGLAGLVLGFLLKNFGRIASLIIAAAFIAVLVLHYTHVYEMPYEKLLEVLNVPSTASMQDIINAKIAWSKDHLVAVVSGLVGVLVGWKVG